MIALIGLGIIVWVMYKRDKERERRLKELDDILNDKNK